MKQSSLSQMGVTTIILYFFISVFACSADEEQDEMMMSQNQDQNTQDTTSVQDTLSQEDTTQLPPVESNPANTDYDPAFEGQTRVAGMKTETKISISPFAQGLNRPWGMENLPDGRMILTEKGGTLRIVSQSGSVSAAIGGLPAVNSAGQGGLLDIAVDPDFSNNRTLYWTYSRNINNGTATAVAKGQLSADETKIENAQTIYTALPAFNGNGHYGSRIAWDSNDHLFISTGERYSNSIRVKAQDLDAALGKVLRINTDGGAVPGNPFQNQANALDEIYSYGHRNPQGLAIHSQNGELWLIEHGPRGGDEVNLVQPGKNYGWPVISYGIEYGGSPIGAGITQQSGMEQPVYYWDPSIAPCGATFYSGSLISEWRNNLFVTALAGQHLIRLKLEGNRVVGEERLLEGVARFRDVLEGNDGAVYVMEDGPNATIHRLGL